MSERGRLRRTPVQSRSRERVERILDSARELLATCDIADVTTRRITECADVPIATLYQFFANREAVFRQLLERDLRRCDQRIAEDVEVLRAEGVPHAIDLFTAVHRDRFLRHAELVNLYFTFADSALVRDHHRRCAQSFGGLLISSGVLPASTDPRVFGVAIGIAEGTIEYAYRERPRDEWVIGQGRTLLRLYLESHCR